MKKYHKFIRICIWFTNKRPQYATWLCLFVNKQPPPAKPSVSRSRCSPYVTRHLCMQACRRLLPHGSAYSRKKAAPVSGRRFLWWLHANYFLLTSLRWHYPNQVQGRGLLMHTSQLFSSPCFLSVQLYFLNLFHFSTGHFGMQLF